MEDFVTKVRVLLSLAVLPLVVAVGCSDDKKAADEPKVITRIDQLVVTCGAEVVAHGAGAQANEVVKIMVKEQVAGGIEIASDSAADAKGNFTMNDVCDPKSPNAEVPAVWTFEGTKSGRKGEVKVEYRLP
jgi:hypothetical protein